MPTSVIVFAISAFVTIAYGLQMAHIRTVGFEDYKTELMKKHDITTRHEAHQQALFNFWAGWFITVAGGITATASLAISVLNIINPQ